MKSQIIIHLDTSRRPLVRVRDGALFLSCWIMWAGVLAAIFNGGEWGELGASFQHWIVAQEIFIRSLLASFHLPVTYILMIGALMIGFVLWSALNHALAPPRNKQANAPLTLEDMARHFDLDLALIGAMQKEKQVLVFHALSGAVIDLRILEKQVQQKLLEA